MLQALFKFCPAVDLQDDWSVKAQLSDPLEQAGEVDLPLAEGEMVCFVGFSLMVDNIWEPHMIRTHPAHRRKGHARALLSHASDQLLARGIVPLYSADADNEASLRTARDVGYREAFRVFAFEAALAGGP